MGNKKTSELPRTQTLADSDKMYAVANGNSTYITASDLRHEMSDWGKIGGTLANQTDLKGQLDDIGNRIDNIINLNPGSTTGDAELADIRVGVHGQTYNSAGDAVRANSEQLYSMKTGFDGVTYSSPAAMVQGEDQKLQDKIESIYYDYGKYVIGRSDYWNDDITITSGAYIDDDGVVTSNTGSFYTDLITLPSGGYTVFYINSGSPSFRIHGYKDGTWVKMILKTGANSIARSFTVDNTEVDAIRFSGNKATATIKFLTSEATSLQSAFDQKNVYDDDFRKYALDTIDYLKSVGKTSGYVINDSGEITSNSGSFYTDIITLPSNGYSLIYSSSNSTTVFRIHGYKNGTWVRMLTKKAGVASYNKIIFSIDNSEIDAIRISGNSAVLTLHYLFNISKSDEQDMSVFYKGKYKCLPSDFKAWYECLSTSEEIASCAFGRNKGYSDTLALYDGLVDNKYVTKNLIGHINSLNLDIYEYVFKPKIYVRSPQTSKDGILYRPTPKILLSAGIHGFEKGGVFANYLFLQNLVDHWKDNDSLKNIRNYVEIHCLPIINPYGFTNNTYYNENNVNINRNFGSSTWEYHEPGAQGSGDEPFDQEETQIVVSWVNANSDAFAYLDHHTNGEYYSTEPLGLNLCYWPSIDYGDEYSHRWYNVINKHIEAQTLMYPEEFPDIDFALQNSDTQNSYLGRYQETTSHGTMSVWSLERTTTVGMTLETINGWKSSSSVSNENAEIPLFSETAMRIGAENVGNFICQLLQEFCDN